MIETPWAVTPTDSRKPPELPPSSHAHARLPRPGAMYLVEECARCRRMPSVDPDAQLVGCNGCGVVHLGLPAGVHAWNAEQRKLRRERSRQRRAAAWVALALLLAIVAIVRWRAGGAA